MEAKNIEVVMIMAVLLFAMPKDTAAELAEPNVGFPVCYRACYTDCITHNPFKFLKDVACNQKCMSKCMGHGGPPNLQEGFRQLGCSLDLCKDMGDDKGKWEKCVRSCPKSKRCFYKN